MLVIQLSNDGIRDVRQALTGVPDRDRAQTLTDSLPDGPALWRVPASGEDIVRRDLTGVDEVARGIRLAEIIARRTDPPALLRPWLARRLFDDWNTHNHAELLTAQWNSLNAGDRGFWTDRARDYLAGSAAGT